MKTLKVLSLALLAMITLWSCQKDPDPLTISSIIAEGTNLEGNNASSDLNAATTADDVALDATITVTFDREVDATTVNTTNIKLSDSSGDLTITVSASGSAATIDPADDFTRGTDYTLSMNGILATDEGELANTSRTFTTEGRAPVVVPNAENQVAYWTFDNTTAEQGGNFPTQNEINVAFDIDRFGQPLSALSFDGDETLVEVADGSELLNTNSFTMSIWIKSDGSDVNDNGETRGQFVLGCAAWNGFQFEVFGNYGGCKLAASYTVADGNKAAQDLWWSTSGDLGWQGWTYDKDISGIGGLAAVMKDQWTHIVCSYDADTKIGTMYFNGELVKSQDYNLYGDTHALFGTTGMGYNGNPAPGDRLAFGFIQGSEDRIVGDDWANPVGFPDNNHFKGLMDDVRFFNTAFSSDDVEALYNAEAN
jgi:hypothetical protein